MGASKAAHERKCPTCGEAMVATSAEFRTHVTNCTDCTGTVPPKMTEHRQLRDRIVALRGQALAFGLPPQDLNTGYGGVIAWMRFRFGTIQGLEAAVERLREHREKQNEKESGEESARDVAAPEPVATDRVDGASPAPELSQNAHEASAAPRCRTTTP